MKRILLGFSFLLLVSVTLAQKKHVVLISIDGLRPDFYKDKSWNTPNLQKLMSHGVYADGVNSVFPSVTYPSHTTIITGALPAKHGVFSNVPFESEKGRWYWEESYIKTNTLWDAVKSAGLKSAAIMWPVSVGAPIDYNFPVRRADKGDKTAQLQVTKPFVTPGNLLIDMQKSIGRLDNADFNSNTIDITIGRMANYIIETYKPDLTAIHFVSVDHEQHEFGRDSEIVRETVTRVDSIIGTVMQTVQKAGLWESTAFIVTGDHGMVDVKYNLSPNVWLADNGLIDKNTWKAKFNSVGGSAFLYLKDKNDNKTLNQIKDILSSLPESQKKLFRVLEKEEMSAVGTNTDAVLALALEKGVTANQDINGSVVKTVKKLRGAHGYFPDFKEIETGFIASGAGINSDVIVPEMGIKDIAPLISELLGLEFYAPDGVLISEILTESKM